MNLVLYIPFNVLREGKGRANRKGVLIFFFGGLTWAKGFVNGTNWSKEWVGRATCLLGMRELWNQWPVSELKLGRRPCEILQCFSILFFSSRWVESSVSSGLCGFESICCSEGLLCLSRCRTSVTAFDCRATSPRGKYLFIYLFILLV